MIRRPPRSTRTDTLFPDTTLFRSLRDWVGDELAPGADIFGDALIPIIRQVASPFFHPVSTCRMGRTDAADAVLDPRCRVRGIAGLRVVDASIFPTLPNAMTTAAVEIGRASCREMVCQSG